MFARIWRFTTRPEDRVRFEAAYGPEGDWAQLFARADAFLGTELLRTGPEAGTNGPPAYVTIDRWRDRSDWLAFLTEHGEAYRALDLQCEPLTLDEAEIGDFVTA